MNTLATGFTIIDWQTFHVHGEACKRMIRALMNPSHPGTNSHQTLSQPCPSLPDTKDDQTLHSRLPIFASNHPKEDEIEGKRQGKADFTPLMPSPDSQLEDFIDGSRRYHKWDILLTSPVCSYWIGLRCKLKDRGALVCEMSLFHVVVDGVIKLWRGRGGSNGADFFQKIYT